MDENPNNDTSLETPTPDTVAEPAPTPTPVVEQKTEVPAKAKKKSPKTMLAGIAAAALIVIGGGGAAAYTQWYQNSDKVVHDAIVSLINTKTLTATGTILYEDKDTKVTVNLDTKNGETGSEMAVKANIAIDNEDMKQDFDLEGVGRFIDDTVYIKVSGIKGVIEEMPGIDSATEVPAYLDSVIEMVEDKWISIKSSDYAEMSEEVANQQECLTDAYKKILTDKSAKKEIEDLYKDNQIIVIKKELGSKSVNGTSSFGYEIEADESAAKAFAEGLENTTIGKEIKACSDDVDFDDITEDFKTESGSESIDKPTVELWVSKFGHNITELSIKGNSGDDNSYSAVLQPVFNANVSIETPEDATSLKTIIDEIQTAMTQHYMNMFSSEDFNFEDYDASSDNFQLNI